MIAELISAITTPPPLCLQSTGPSYPDSPSCTYSHFWTGEPSSTPLGFRLALTMALPLPPTRSNVGNAKLYGMLPDLGITDASVYNSSLALYFGECLLYFWTVVELSGVSLARRSVRSDGANVSRRPTAGYCLFEIPANIM